MHARACRAEPSRARAKPGARGQGARRQPGPGRHGPEADARLAEATAIAGDCEAALEILDETGTRLAHALNCLRKVPDDLASTYETPYQLVYDGGHLPYDGEFLTGVKVA